MILITPLLAAGCGSSDPQTTARKVASLAASTHLVADARLANAVSGRYAAQLFQASAEQLTQLSKTLESSHLEAPTRTDALQAASELQRVIRAMAASAEGDTAALRRDRAQLEVLERTAKELAASAGQQ